MVTVVRCFLSRTIVFTIFWKSNFSISTKIKCWLLQDNWNVHFLRSNDSPFLLNRTNALLSSYSLWRKINKLKLTNLKFIKKHICHIFLNYLCDYFSPRWWESDQRLRLRGWPQRPRVLHHCARGVQHRGLRLQGGWLQLFWWLKVKTPRQLGDNIPTGL